MEKYTVGSEWYVREEQGGRLTEQHRTVLGVFPQPDSKNEPESDLIVYEDENGVVRSLPRGSAEAWWRKFVPKWEVGKKYRSLDDSEDPPETVEKVFENGEALVWWHNTSGNRHIGDVRNADTRQHYIEVRGE